MRVSNFTSLAVLVSAAAGCGGPDFLVVTIESRPAVHSPMTLSVKVGNGASEVAQTYTVTASSFPASFSVGPDLGDTALTISVEARDAAGLLAGRGSSQIAAGAESGKITLESADFVVNTDFAGDQVPSTDFETYGFQVAASGDGKITTVYRDTACPAAGCDIFARRFDSAGRALSSQIAAGTNSFKISSRPTSSILSSPAVAANGSASIAVWDYDDPGAGTAQGISCRPLDGNGNASANEITLAEVSPDVVSAAGLTNSNFVIAWSAIPNTLREIRAAVVRPDCTLLGIVNTVSTDPAVSATRGSVAANVNGIMFAWVASNGVYVRGYRNDLQPTTAVINVVAPSATEKVEHARIAAYAGGFAIIVRWALITGSMGPGRLEMYRISNAGALQGQPTLVSAKSGSDFESKQSFGVASRPDGTLMTVWHSCNENGDGEGCGVFGRVFAASGSAAGEEFVLGTTTQGNQTRPSVAGLEGAFITIWSDESGTPPDPAGTSVRARVLYPPTSGGSSQ